MSSTLDPRKLASFGVASLLQEKSTVYYTTLMQDRNLGRVSDLLAARLNTLSISAHRIRLSIQLGVYEAYRHLAGVEYERAQKLREPLVLECGVDASHLAIGVAMTVSDSEWAQVTVEGGAFQRLLGVWSTVCPEVVVRRDALSKRIEVVGVIPRGLTRVELDSPGVVQWVDVDLNAAETISEHESVELGDLDYPTLLREETVVAALKDKNVEPIKVGGHSEIEATQTKIRAGTGDAPLETIDVKGHDEQEPEAETVKGQAEIIGGEANQVKGQAEIIGGEANRVKGQAEIIGGEINRIKGQAEVIGDEKQVIAGSQSDESGESRRMVRGSSTGDDGLEPVDVRVPVQDEEEKPKSFLSGLFKKVWPFRPSTESELADDEQEEESSEVDIGLKKPKKTSRKTPKGEAQPEANEEAQGEESTDAEQTNESADLEVTEEEAEAEQERTDTLAKSEAALQESQAVIDELGSEDSTHTSGLDATIERAMGEMESIKSELKSERSKKFVESLMSDLVSEKAKLGEYLKSVNRVVRQREVEFKNRERALSEEAKVKSEQVRQRDTMIKRLKDQVGILSANIDKLRQSNHGSGDSGEDLIKSKLSLAQRNLLIAKEEAEKLKKEVEALKNDSTRQQKGSNHPEQAQLAAKAERATRQVEEYRKLNQQLMDRLNEMKKDKGPNVQAENDDLKKKLAGAMKVISANKRESDRLSTKLEEVQKEEQRMKVELQKALNELKRLKRTQAAKGQSGGGDSNGSGTPPGSQSAA